jgi:hypothetical protein
MWSTNPVFILALAAMSSNASRHVPMGFWRRGWM